MAKYIAFHLPQYHLFEENEKWWGKGFTDWNNVKTARPLFPGHCQPVVPLDDNYYNMLSEETILWQQNLAKAYGIYGFCYYHYYFNGKLLMEKPLELMLKSKESDFPFCLCWANEPWTRAWDGKTSEVLMPQNYGNENDWKNHFDYLLPFFKDPRYIKIYNKPLFVLYRTNNITRCDEMIGYLNSECIKNGFDGIYICEELNAFQDKPVCKNSEAVIAFEPSNIQRDRGVFKKIINSIYSKIYVKRLHSGIKIFDYDKTWRKILSKNYNVGNKKMYFGAFVGWDNTPRKKDRGIVYINENSHKFGDYMRKLNAKADEHGSEFVFINAWNEWAEGAYLEPDVRSGYAYLEVLKKSKM